ncbi:MAG: VOC family protein [Chloroflexi bacterium]|nr:VOC family protein [Chloroflexota bacterium]
MITRIRFVPVTASRFDDAVRFYRDTLGIPVLREVVLHGKPPWYELGTAVDDAQFVVAGKGATGAATEPGGVAIVLESDNLHADYEALQAKGVQFDGPPVEEEWRGLFATFRGPDGVRLALWQPPEQL